MALTSTPGDDALIADPGVFASNHAVGVCYRMALKDALLPGRSGKPIQLVVIPSLGPEYAVFAELGKDRQPRIVARRMKKSLWASAFSADREGECNFDSTTTCDRFRGVAKDTSEAVAPLDMEQYQKLAKTWQSALATVKSPSEASGIRDGVQYYFGGCGDPGCISGIAESPRNGTRIAQLVQLAEMLIQYSETDDSNRAQLGKQLELKIDAVMSAFNHKPVN